MKFPVMVFTCRFMTQKITVGSCLLICTITLLGFFSDRKCQGTVRITFFDPANQSDQFFIGVISVFSSLEYKGPKSQFISFPAADKNILFCQTVTLGIPVAAADPTVIAVIFTVVCKLDQTTHIDFISVYLLPHLICLFPGIQICFF